MFEEAYDVRMADEILEKGKDEKRTEKQVNSLLCRSRMGREMNQRPKIGIASGLITGRDEVKKHLQHAITRLLISIWFTIRCQKNRTIKMQKMILYKLYNS